MSLLLNVYYLLTAVIFKKYLIEIISILTYKTTYSAFPEPIYHFQNISKHLFFYSPCNSLQ